MKRVKNNNLVLSNIGKVSIVLGVGFLLLFFLNNNIRANNDKKANREVVLRVKNMTCSMCSITIKKSISNLEGVIKVKVTRTPPMAIVQYDGKKVTKEKIARASTDTGYPATIISDNKIKEN